MKLRTTTLISIAAVCAFCSAAAGCLADSGKSSSSVTIRLGEFIPSNGLAKSALGSSWWQLGLDCTFESSGSTVPFVYLDSEFASRSVSDNSGDSISLAIATVGVGLGVRETFGTSQSAQPYLGAGVGAYFNNASAQVQTSNEFGSGSTNNTNIGYKLLAGILIQKRLTLEAAYSDVGDLGGLSLSGTSLDIGYTF